MAALAGCRLLPRTFLRFNRSLGALGQQYATGTSNTEPVTHTGQQFVEDDYRRVRFEDKGKLVNTNFAIDLIAEDPVVVCTQRVVFSHSGGPLGHPKVYINLDQPGVHTCGYSGRKFVSKKYYDEKTMGPSITYETYLDQVTPGWRDE